MIRIVVAALLLMLAYPANAQSEQNRTGQSQQTKLDKEIAAARSKLDELTVEKWKADGMQGHCWGCMHGCTPKQDEEICGWKNK